MSPTPSSRTFPLVRCWTPPKKSLSSAAFSSLFRAIRGSFGVARTNEWGEFHFEFESEPGVTLEIKARENFWISAGLPDLQSVICGT